MKTVVNLTNHVYFNLDGHKQWKDLSNQTVAIFADKYTPVDETAIPFGEIADVQGRFEITILSSTKFGTKFCTMRDSTFVVISNPSRDQLRYKKWKVSFERKFGKRKVSEFFP